LPLYAGLKIISNAVNKYKNAASAANGKKNTSDIAIVSSSAVGIEITNEAPTIEAPRILLTKLFNFLSPVCVCFLTL